MQGRRRAWILWAGAAATLVVAVAVVVRWAPPGVPQATLRRSRASWARREARNGDGWQPLDGVRAPAWRAGSRLRTQAAGRLALTLAGGESLRLAARTEVMLDAPGRLYVQAGTIYVDSGERPAAARIEVVTPAGTARDVGTQFELHVEGAALRLRVREGLVIARPWRPLVDRPRGRAAHDRRARRRQRARRSPGRTRPGNGRKPSPRCPTWTASRPRR